MQAATHSLPTMQMIQTTAATRTTPTTTPTSMTTTTITSDPGILCFHHCNVKVFCFTLPHICPNCKKKLDTGGEDDDDDDNGNGDGMDDGRNEDAKGNGKGCKNAMGDNEEPPLQAAGDRMTNGGGGGGGRMGGICALAKLLPFRLPYPFVRASQYPCAIVLRPTVGDFLNDYNNSKDLHMAVTTSTGCIVEFDRHGLQRHRADNKPEWGQCLLVGDVPEPWYDYWDQILMQISKQADRWTVAQYQEDTHNCYTFVLAFLQALAYDKLSEAARSKTSFCEKYIVPRTTTAGKYISLYRKLRDKGIYVHPHPNASQQQHQHQHQHHHHHHHHHQGHQGHQVHHHGRSNHAGQQNQHQQHQHSRGLQNEKQDSIKSRVNGGSKSTQPGNASAAQSGTISSNGNGTKAVGMLMRSPNLCTIEE